ncbi:hypothetical protein JNO63_07885 [Anaerococcus sp. mt242]|uniref:hypothetical protein n=1 Tax=Anaerococcus sp. mt242 TaxID=2661917 RepID=UPI001933101F|nr:hypothetical protein [Anaerococcus sp. mt242]MBM0047013.1 hypothetical protein [Anaerococcus sp. mt242]
MKIKNYGKILILTLAIGLAAPVTNSLAIDTEVEIQNINELKNIDKASKNEIEAYNNLLEQKNKAITPNPELEKDLENLANRFGEEYNLRYDLKANIELIKKIDAQSFKELIKDSQKVLNSDDLAKIKDQSEYLKSLISQEQKQESLLLTDEEIKNIDLATQNFITNGILFEDETSEKPQNLEQNIKAVQNSKAYYSADVNLKSKYDEILNKANENKENEKANELLNDFLKSADKLNFEIPASLVKEDETEIENQLFIAGNTDTSDQNLIEESQTIENPTQTTGSSATQNESAFLKNDKTSSKYKELSDAQKRELDAIDTNKDGKLSNEELDASANYTSNLGSDSWLYPFTEKALSESNADDNKKDNGAENTNAEVNKDSENQNQEKEVPKTVTIDNKTKSSELNDEDKDTSEDTDDDKEEEFNETEANQTVAPRENTNAASIVKTGIKSLGYVVGILVIALGAYYFLSKNQKNKK